MKHRNLNRTSQRSSKVQYARVLGLYLGAWLFSGVWLLCFGVSAAEPVSFTRDVAPVLRAKCLTCHGPEKAKGNYRLDTFELLKKPGSSKIAPITAGDPSQSHLYELLTASDEDDRMPQKDEPLPTAQIASIERWIREGATFDGPDPKASLASLVGFTEQPEAPGAYASPVPIIALAFHPGEDQIAVGGYHEVTIWDAADGRLRRRLGNVAQRTFALAYSHDGA